MAISVVVVPKRLSYVIQWERLKFTVLRPKIDSVRNLAWWSQLKTVQIKVRVVTFTHTEGKEGSHTVCVVMLNKPCRKIWRSVTQRSNQSFLSPSLKSLWQCGHRYSPSILRLAHIHTLAWLSLVNCQESCRQGARGQKRLRWCEHDCRDVLVKRSCRKSGPRVLMRLQWPL